jgi:hypothetical protein
VGSEALCWLHEASAVEMEDMTYSVTFYFETAHTNEARSGESLAPQGMKHSYYEGQVSLVCCIHLRKTIRGLSWLLGLSVR